MTHYLAQRENWQKEASAKGEKANSIFQRVANIYLTDQYKDEFYVSGKCRFNYLGTKFSVEPDVKIVSNVTGNTFLFEVKRQNDWGNAHERAYKFFPGGGIVKMIQRALSVSYIPLACVFSGNMINSTMNKYIVEITEQYRDYPEHFLLWKDFSTKILTDYLETTVLPRLRGMKIDY